MNLFDKKEYKASSIHNPVKSKGIIVFLVISIILLILSFLLDNVLMPYSSTIRMGIFNPFFIFIGAQIGLGLYLALLLIIHFHYQKRQKTAILLLVILITAGISILLKYLIARKRPDLLPLFIKDSYSFPSSHAAIAASTIPFILDKDLGRKYLKIAILVLAILIILTGYYNGVHYASDVVAGAIIGIIIALCVKKSSLEFLHRKQK